MQQRDAVQRSASSRYGVDIRIVIPPARKSASSFQNSRRDSGSTPVVGSSRRISSGWWTRVQANASFCFLPPESWSASRAGMDEWSIEQLIAALPIFADPVNLGEEGDVLVNRQIAVEAEAL